MLGCHIDKGKNHVANIKAMIESAAYYGVKLSAIQLFVIGPRKYNINHTTDDLVELANYIRDEHLLTIVHGSYMDNPWGAKPAFALKVISEELNIIRDLGANGLIIHLPTLEPQPVVDVISKIFNKNNIVDKAGPVLYLENAASVKGFNYSIVDNIAALFNMIPDEFKPYIGFCIDTAHMWAAGINIADESVINSWCRNFSSIGFRYVMIALNDQVYDLGSSRDEHHTLLRGKIWNDTNVDSLRILLDWIVANNYPILMERHADVIDNDFTQLNKLGYFTNK